MEKTPKHIQRLKDQVESIDKTIDELRGANWNTPNHNKMMELQELAGQKEQQIKRFEHLHNLRGQKFAETQLLIAELVDLINVKYSHVKDEVEDIHQIVLAKQKEFFDEMNRRED